MTAATTLDSRYRLLAQLAVGGTSTVHLAQDTVLGRTVAVKVLHPQLAADPAVVDRFRREALAAASLSHPNVVTLFDVARNGSYLVMEHVDGSSLRDVLRLRGRMRPEEALALLGPVAAGLSAAHDAGLVHRDVKPENVLLSTDGHIKIGDFGLARQAASASTTYGPNMFAGSPQYSSPEAVRGGSLDARSDVYALGVVLYECLTGEAPFRADTPFATAMRHITERVPPPSAATADVPAAVDEVVRRATAPDPSARYANASEFAVALRAAVPDGPAPVDLHDLDSGTTVLPVEAADTVITDEVPTVPAPPRRLGGLLRRRWRALLLILVLAIGGGGWLVYDQVIAPVTDVPSDLVGAEVDAARTSVTQSGLVPKVADQTQFSRTVAADHVVAVTPSDRARRGEVVTLILSGGPRQVTVPAVVGRPQAAALAALESDFDVTVTAAFDEQVEDGLVISTSPEGDVTVDQGSAVEVVVSKGREPIDVPDVTGTPEKDARAKLTDRGLEPKITGSAYDPEVPSGSILTQSVGPDDDPLFRGDTVELTVSDGPEPFALPDVRRQSEDAAVARLKKLDLKVEVSYQNTFFGFGAGLVGQQSPRPDTPVVPGDTIQLLVGR